jgi:stress response protein SCP2
MDSNGERSFPPATARPALQEGAPSGGTCPGCNVAISTPYCPRCGQPVTRDLPLGALIAGKYEVLEKLGQGAFGATYSVKDLLLEKVWVAKVLLNAWDANPQVRDYFLTEARILAKLECRGIPSVSQIMETDGMYILLQDRIDGQPYDRILALEGPRTPQDVERLLSHVLHLLVYLHEHPEHPILHRDIKPANLMRDREGKTWLIDFGAVKELGQPHEASNVGSTRIFTAHYAPPEQIAGGDIGPRTDLYALGCTVLVLLTGLDPARLREDPTWNSQRERLRPPLRDLLTRMIDLDPGRRPASAREALTLLDAVSGSGVSLPTSPIPGPMLRLIKGQKLKLSEVTTSTRLHVGVDFPITEDRSFHIVCFGLDAGERLFGESYVILRDRRTPCQGVVSLGPIGPDKAVFEIDLARLSPEVKKLAFALMHDGTATLSQFAGGYVRLFDAAGNEARFTFNGVEFVTERAIIMAELYNKEIWRFATVAQGYAKGSLALFEHYQRPDLVAILQAPPAAPPPRPLTEPPVPPVAQPRPIVPPQPSEQPLALVRGQRVALGTLSSETTFELGLTLQFPPNVICSVYCFGLDERRQLMDERYFLHNGQHSPCGAIASLGPIRGDKETFCVALSRLPGYIRRLAFCVAIFSAGSFSMLQGGHMRLVASNKELARFSFEDAGMTNERALIVAEIYYTDRWRLGVVSQGFEDGLPSLARHLGAERLLPSSPAS